MTGLESSRWLRLGGAPAVVSPYGGNERLDRVRRAVSIYRHQLIPRFWERPVQPQVLHRLSAGIARQLGQRAVPTSDCGRLLDDALQQLSLAVGELPETDQGPLVDYRDLLGGLGRPAFQAVPTPALVHAVVGAGLGAGPRHVVVQRAAGAAEAGATFSGTTVMTPDVFRFYLCQVDPLEYFSLLRDRVILGGADPLLDPFPLARSALRATVCHYAVDLLTFPYRPGLADLSESQFRNLLYGWLLRTLKYFEDGRFTFDYGEIRAHFGARHADNEPRFRLVHDVAGDVSRLMAG